MFSSKFQKAIHRSGTYIHSIESCSKGNIILTSLGSDSPNNLAISIESGGLGRRLQNSPLHQLSSGTSSWLHPLQKIHHEPSHCFADSAIHQPLLMTIPIIFRMNSTYLPSSSWISFLSTESLPWIRGSLSYSMISLLYPDWMGVSLKFSFIN